MTCDTHLQRRLLDGDLTEDAGAVVGTNGLQLLLVEREELSAGQDAEAGDGTADRQRAINREARTGTLVLLMSHDRLSALTLD